ncbi:hypothetical protein LS72_007245 [Helicobacter apodemus]|uniref:Capsule biosynthesis protein CapA n=1 Tax=Helicobacter apodemus TaxID=135569 RepID=A0A4V6I6H7_9HELI|nr:hypothetical protein [Helicobacter apodemus]TLE15013.1 hypothetical protein LS72_007245 [Helicobacter apodemus]
MVFKKSDLLELNTNLKKYKECYIVKFEKKYALEYIKIYLDEQYLWCNQQNLLIKIKKGEEFELIKSIPIYSEEVLYIELKSEFYTQELQISMEGNTKCKLNAIRVFSRKYPGLVVASRGDGIGARLLPLLNALVLSKYTDFKFGYTWWDCESLFSFIEKVDDNKIASLHTGKEEQIFSKDFIKQYSYTKTLPMDRGYFNKIALEQLKKLPFDKDWGWFVSYTLTHQGIFKDVKSIGHHYKKVWNEIGFTKRIKGIIKDASRLSKALGEFIIIHIRSGDIVFHPNIQTQQNMYWNKAMPIEIAIELIESNQDKIIVLCSDDFNVVKSLKNFYKNIKIYCIEDFNTTLQSTERNFFEISFMSNAKTIYSGDSSFAKVASYIGLGDEPSFYWKIFDYEKLYEIMARRIHKFKAHLFQKTYSAYYTFQVAKLAYKKDYLDYLYLAFSLHPNVLYIIQLFINYYECSRFNEAEQFIKEIELDERFFENYFKSLYFKESYTKILELTKKFPNNKDFIILRDRILKQTSGNIPPKPLGASSRIKSHLSYKLGQALILNSKSLWGYIRMPYVLSYIKDKHKQEQKEYQEKIKKNPSLKLPTLESYRDYKDALKIKNTLSYQLGEAFIKAKKQNFFKFPIPYLKANNVNYSGGGGILWFYFVESKRIVREWRGRSKK